MPGYRRVIVDEREKGSEVPKYLKRLGLHIVYQLLPVGDYLISPKCAVERKTAEDFVKSIYDGRLFEQLRKLTDEYETAILLVEGDLYSLVDISTRPRSLLGALAYAALGFGAHVFQTPSPRYTAELIATIALHGEYVRPAAPIPVPKRKLRARTLEELSLIHI